MGANEYPLRRSIRVNSRGFAVDGDARILTSGFFCGILLIMTPEDLTKVWKEEEDESENQDI